MLRPPWQITPDAVQRYMHARQWGREEGVREELEELAEHAQCKQVDDDGRELWRSPQSRQNGAGLRWVVHPPRRPGDLPYVLWVGYSRPPTSLFDESAPAPRQHLECAHLPTLGDVYEVQLTPVSTPAKQRTAITSEAWRVRVCARCAEAVRAATLSRR